MSEKVFVITTVADEEDIIEYTLSHWISQGVDKIIVAINLPTDQTHEKVMWIKGPIIIRYDDDPAWYQGRKMTALANFAAQHGADIIIPCDADELFYSMDETKTVSDLLRENSKAQVVGIPMWNHFCTDKDINNDPNPFNRMVWRCKERNPLDKVAYRYDRGLSIDEGNHRILRNGDPVPGVGIGLGIRHFPYRNADHFVHKADRGSKALAAAKDLNPTIGAHWRQYGESLERGGAEALKDHYRRYFTFEGENIEKYMTYDPAPYKGDL